MSKFNLQQKNAIDISKGKFIIANAGSGKTTVLTKRFNNILEQKVESIATTISNTLSQIKNENVESFSNVNIERFVLSYLFDNFKFDFVVIVSFSENTVKSLLEKVKNLLHEKKVSIKITEQPIHYYIYSFLLQNYNNFRISTIHGFCNNVITEYSHELNLDNSYIKKDKYLENLSKEKAFTIINDITFLMLYHESNNIFIDGEPLDKTKFETSLLNLYRLFGKFEINNFKRMIFETSVPVKIFKLNQSISYLQSEIKRLQVDTEPNEITNNIDIITLQNALDFNRFYIYIIKVFSEVLKSIYAEYNLVNFDNQLSVVYEYSKNPENAKKISSKIEHFLIDEFQDTDFIQFEIFKNILDANTEIIPFFVGDPKQSIYRFRSSDVTVFNTAREYFNKNGRTEDVVLDLSYRNTPVISSFVNTLYNSTNITNIISKTEFKYNNLVYPLGLFDNINLTELRDSKQKGLLYEGRIDYIVGFKVNEKTDDKSNQKSNKDEVEGKTIKYLELARYIDSLVNDKNLSSYHPTIEKDNNTNGTNNEDSFAGKNYISEKVISDEYPEGKLVSRKIEFKDIAVLSKKNLDFNDFDEYFKAYNIPYQMNKSAAFYKLEEIRAAVSFLKFINNPEDSEALLNLLTSNFYGIELELLLHYLEIFSTPNYSHETKFKYISLWERLKQIELLTLETNQDFEAYQFFLESKAKAENYSTQSTLYYKKSLDFFKNNPEFIQYIEQILGELELYLILKNKVFSSELLTMFLKGNTNYNNQYKNTKNGTTNTYYENLNKLVNILHDIESIGFINYNDVINRLENLSKEDENNILEEGENAVNFLTFHSSKGLEFPVVIVLDSSEHNNKTITEIEKEFGFYSNNFSVDKIDTNLELNKYRSHLKQFKVKETSYFKDKLEKYETIDDLNLNYVAITRAKNILCFFLHSSYPITNNFHGNDITKWKYIDLELKLNKLINKNKHRLTENYFVENEQQEVNFVYLDNNNENHNSVPMDIFVNYFFYNYTKLEFESNTVNKIENISTNDNDLTFTGTFNDNIDSVKNETDYSFDTIDTFYSATKLMSVKEGKNKYEFKYILGLEQEFEDEFNKITSKKEFDEFYDADFENNIVNSNQINNTLTTNHLFVAAQFGLAFHFVMQYIVELFPEGKLDFEFFEELIAEIRKEYKDLSEEKISEIGNIVKKLSLSKFILNIIRNKENLKTEFNLKMPFLPSQYHFILGNIDLIYKDNNGIYHIIDWKTNRNKNENTKLQYDIQRKLYTYLIHNLDKNAEVNFSLVFTNDILNNDEEYWETKFETKINIENIEEEIKDLISNSLEIEKVLFEY